LLGVLKAAGVREVGEGRYAAESPLPSLSLECSYSWMFEAYISPPFGIQISLRPSYEWLLCISGFRMGMG